MTPKTVIPRILASGGSISGLNQATFLKIAESRMREMAKQQPRKSGKSPKR